MDGTIRRWWPEVQRLLFPRTRCLACNDPRNLDPGEPLCDSCAQALCALKLNQGICPHCLSPARTGDPCRYCMEGGMRYLHGAYAPYSYHGVSQRLVIQFKFGGVFYAARPLVDAMAVALGGRGFDALVPVPLHPARMRERGFNQAFILAQGVGSACGMPVLEALTKPRNTQRQSSLSHDRRASNVAGSFEVVGRVSGLRLLLVDDVRTTGNTARACAKALLEANAAEVSLLSATVAAAHSKESSSSSSSPSPAAI